jgi:hypothetical protein
MEIMNQIDLVVANDAEELTRRRGLAAARRTRETERTLLLRKLVRMERQADQLRGWIAQRKADVGASSELQRMVDWVKAELAGLEEFLNPSRLSQLLQTRNLFPKDDDLFDPLGEPPPKRPLGR